MSTNNKKQILVLTPDGVGSTFLQRSLCMFATLAEPNWINIHELTNGIAVDKEHLIKDRDIGYSQNLNEIIDLLKTNQHNLIARLAQYHIINRKDSLKELDKFYNFLNENFTIIACYRKNIFEYAHSWTIRDYKKILNVYTFNEKKTVHPLDDQFDLDSNFFENKLIDYNNYTYWVDDNFNVDHVFDYDNLENIELFFSTITGIDKDIFLKTFGISLYEYCHMSNLSNLNELPNSLLKSFAKIRWYAYQLVKHKVMPNSLPLKMNSFENKINKTKNFSDLVVAYNKVAKKSNRFATLTEEELREIASVEQFGFIQNKIVIDNAVSRFT
jgi:hypothetical protein